MASNNLADLIISPDVSIRGTLDKIQKNGRQGVFVCNMDGEFLGIVMDPDIRRAILRGSNLDNSVRTVVNTAAFTIRHEISDSEIEKKILESGKVLVPKLDNNNKVIGFYFLFDLLKKNTKTINDNQNRDIVLPPARLLVIGGAGYIGSILVEKLLRIGYNVRILDTFLYDSNSINNYVNHENLEVIKGDFRNTEHIDDAVKNVEAVIHLGDIVGDPACSVDHEFTIENNYQGTRNVVDACIKNRINKFIFASSCSVYGNNDEIVNEETRTNPISLYANCKLECERIILNSVNNYFSPTILRLSTVHGFSYRQRFDLVVNLLTIQALLKKKIHIFGGEQWRPFISVKDICQGIIQVLHADRNNVGNNVFNIGDNRENYTIKDVANIILGELPDTKIIYEDDKSDLRNYRVSFDKIRNTLGYTCEYNILDTIKEIINAHKNGQFMDFDAPHYHNVKTLK